MTNTRGNLLRHFAKSSWQKLKQLSFMDRDVGHALQELSAGHREGYAYHQRIYREDAKVREWVNKPKYF